VQLLIGGEDLETRVILEVLGEDISSGQEKSFSIEYCEDLNSKNPLVWEKLGEYSATNGMNYVTNDIPETSDSDMRVYRLKD
jgi:hypothetical protein